VLPYEDNEPSRNPGRLFLLSIPDLIRDPEGRLHSSFAGLDTSSFHVIARLGSLPESIQNHHPKTWWGFI
jgi:hypothetical protein